MKLLPCFILLLASSIVYSTQKEYSSGNLVKAIHTILDEDEYAWLLQYAEHANPEDAQELLTYARHFKEQCARVNRMWVLVDKKETFLYRFFQSFGLSTAGPAIAMALMKIATRWYDLKPYLQQAEKEIIWPIRLKQLHQELLRALGARAQTQKIPSLMTQVNMVKKQALASRAEFIVKKYSILITLPMIVGLVGMVFSSLSYLMVLIAETIVEPIPDADKKLECLEKLIAVLQQRLVLTQS